MINPAKEYSLERVTRFSCQRISPVREWRVDQLQEGLALE